MIERKVLLIGAGSSKQLDFLTPLFNIPPKLTTLDIEPRHKPDVVWDLNVTPWPFESETFDEVHAYEVLEHLGQQGDAVSFFAHFYEAWRLLKPRGYLAGSVPRWDSKWAWSDPSHRRVISEWSFIYLNQLEYANVGKSTMTDFRSIWRGDFELEATQKIEDRLFFLFKAHKPARA
jgi:SAM-dependent methyltransferase